MHNRLPVVLSTTALLVALFGATPLGHAAGRVIHAVPPFAKTAGYAKFAGNASKLNGRASTLSGAPGTIPVVGRDGKLPASIGAVGLPGPKGDGGPKGDKGDSATALWASVDDNGVLVRNKGAVSSRKLATGMYQVIFNQNVTGCIYQATLGGPTGTLWLGDVTAAQLDNVPAGVTVLTLLQDRVEDRAFFLAVFC